jgi:hypothetical protein
LKNTSLIIGAGEVGTALAAVLGGHGWGVATIDLYPPAMDLSGSEFMHICFPYSPSFVDSVLAYKEQYKPCYTVIHSTVPVGTSTLCGATHSPIRGNHAYMEESIRTFVKFIGGKDADAVAEYFNRAGLRVAVCRRSETTELAKLLCTTFYGVLIEYTKAAERVCDEAGAPFSEAWTLWQTTYNEGYERLGRPEFRRPILAPIQGKIGGHCVLPNAELFDFAFGNLVKELNREH